MDRIRFTLNGRAVELTGLSPTTTLLQYLRDSGLKGTKEGCAEGDCGACSVAWLDTGTHSWKSVNSCLVLIGALEGRRVVSVEGLAQPELHPAQEALVEELGSQCGYCTPGFVMSLFEATYRKDLDRPWKLDDQLCGNLCRCTGYRPIRDALSRVAGSCPDDAFAAQQQAPAEPNAVRYAAAGQRFHAPPSFEALWEALEDPEAVLVAGSTDLGLQVTKQHRRFPCLVSVEALAELDHFRATEEGWSIGATRRLSQLADDCAEALPPVARMLRYFASRQIKNRATLGGNLCNASPIGDMAPVLMALDATAVLRSRTGERRVPLDDFFLGYRKTALQEGEILAAVELPRPHPAARLAAYKVSKRRELDISAVAAGFNVVVEEGVVRSARVVFGGMAATTKRASAVERALVGQPWTAQTVAAAAEAIDQDFSPLSDHRGSAWYRRTVARNLVLGFHEETLEQAVPELPDHPSGTLCQEAGA